MREGFALFMRRPLAFSTLFVAFLFAALLTTLVPLAGALLLMASLPMLSLGFMVASQSALLDGPVHPGQFIEPLRGDAQRRRSLLILCGIYGVASVLILLLADGVDGGRFEELQRLMASGDSTPAEIDAVLDDPRLTWGLIVRFGLATLLAVPFWHAPALVHWAGQGWGQALFSSTLAVWRSKGAFFVYSLAWAGLVAVFGLVAALLFGLLGARQMAGIVALPAGLMFSTAFYVSLLFTFNDSFGNPAAPPAEEPSAPPG
jgi:hypothetical protein